MSDGQRSRSKLKFTGRENQVRTGNTEDARGLELAGRLITRAGDKESQPQETLPGAVFAKAERGT
jgi:hypothetical protein